MAAPMLIGNQLILEEDFDENYIPSEQEIRKYANEIGIDVDNEADLMWLAKEGIVAPLPPEWKPCQDVTGDIYYYNFSSGESTWDHPCDEHYRLLVVQERERNQRIAGASGAKKKKKEKKEKKEKNKKDSAKTGGTRSLALGSLPSPLGSLAPLSGLDAPVLGPISGSGSASASTFPRSLGSGGLEPLKTPGPLGGLHSSTISSVLSNKNEEKVYLTMPGFDDADEILENESSQRSSERQLMNLHLDLDELRGGIQYEESEASAAAQAEERTEPEMQDISGGHSPEPQSPQDSLRGCQRRLSPLADPSRLSDSVNSRPDGLEEKGEVQDKVEDEDDELDVKSTDMGTGEAGDTHKEQGGIEMTLDNEQQERGDGEDEMKGKGDDGGEEYTDNLEHIHTENSVGDADGRAEKVNFQQEIFDRKENVDSAEAVMEEEDVLEEKEGNGQVEDCFSNGIDTKDGRDKEQEDEKSIDDQSGKDGREEEDGGSQADLEQCSLSHRKVTEDEEESCSDRRETDMERKELVAESDASQSEEEVVEVLEMESANPNHLPAENSEACDDMKESSSSINVKVLDLNDTSDAICPPDNNADGEDVEDEMGKYTKTEAAKRHLQSAEKDILPVSKVDRLVLHQSIPSHTARDVQNQPTAARLGSALNLQRPETARGRLSRTSITEVADFETSRQKGVHPAEKDSHFGIWKNEKKVKGEEESEKEKSQKARNKEEERESGDASQRGEKEGKEQFIQEKKRRSFILQEVLFSEEKEKERLEQEKERRISLLHEELKREEKAEKEQFIREKEKRQALLLAELSKEEVKLKEEGKDTLGALRQDLLSKRKEEEAKLNMESDRILEELKESALKERERQLEKLREESETMLKEMRISLEEEKSAEVERLEAQKRLDIERLKAESDQQLQAERNRLQEEKTDYFKLEDIATERSHRELIHPRPQQQLTGYHREMTDLLLEVREQVQQEHEKKLLHLREEHRKELNNIREKHLEEESVQRERLRSTLQEDREHLQASHDLQLERLRIQLHSEIEKAQLTHSHKHSELEDYIYQLELKAKELQANEEILQNKADDLKRKKKMLEQEEEDIDRQTGTLHKVTLERDQLRLEMERMREEQGQGRELLDKMREERNAAQQEVERLREERDKVREESQKVKEDKRRLENKVALLQEQCDRLSRRVGELEECEGRSASRRKDKNQSTSPSDGQTDSSRHGDDPEDPITSTVPDSPSNMPEFFRFTSSHGTCIQKTKAFLEKESSQLQERRAILHATPSNCAQQPNPAQPQVTEQKEMRSLSELSQMVMSGNTPSQKKEQQYVDGSTAGESLLQDASLMARQKKVTFDVTDSDLSSTVDPPDETGGTLTFLAKVHEFTESQQQISGQLHTVLGALGSLAQRQTSTSLPAFPTALSHAAATSSSPILPQVPTLGPTSFGQPNSLWKSSTRGGPGFSSFAASSVTGGLRTCEDVALRRWREIFPEAAEFNSSSLRTHPSYSSYTPANLHMHKSVKVDGHKLQKLIDSNKQWLKMQKEDTSIPLLTRYQASSSQNNLVQLGLDDNDQIRVYHY
ncbi:centrosomal protein of 164 kDa-like isoform X2 [Dunckerocampus dactyliophorus]|uniref:centrosomal protein of 164 kDa-like isoform X2 n=1 Tax=Dunckerocampus dactyliophorus TaxID=161453 RepID=UPI002406DD82|nr:centrosomal protein of 164 kDa-like isoform X2 [Dunckerocampus dactyliophorus]